MPDYYKKYAHQEPLNYVSFYKFLINFYILEISCKYQKLSKTDKYVDSSN